MKNHSTQFEQVTSRPFRVIHSLEVQYEPSSQMIIPLDNEGNCRNANPIFNHSKDRAIDVRVGDVLKLADREVTNLPINAYRESFYETRPETWDGFLTER